MPFQVVQCLTELGLSIKRARISSDGGWFVDGEGCDVLGLPHANALHAVLYMYDPHTCMAHAEFYVTETPKGKVVDPRKLALIKRVSRMRHVDDR